MTGLQIHNETEVVTVFSLYHLVYLSETASRTRKNVGWEHREKGIQGLR